MKNIRKAVVYILIALMLSDTVNAPVTISGRNAIEGRLLYPI